MSRRNQKYPYSTPSPSVGTTPIEGTHTPVSRPTVATTSNNGISSIFVPPSNQKGKLAWGPPFWTTIHTVAASYKPENAGHFKSFLTSFIYLLPCVTCGKNHAAHMNSLNVDSYLNSRDDAFFLTYLLHDMVNREHGKTSPPYDTVKEWYIKNMVEGCPTCGK